MSHFGKIKAALAVEGKTAEFELSELAGHPKPVLILKPAGIENSGLFNASLRFSGAQAKGAKRSEKEQIEDGLREMRELWPHHVIAAWRHVVSDETGEPLDYSPALGRELLDALPADVLLRLKVFASDMNNFRTGDALPPVDAGAIAGN